MRLVFFGNTPGYSSGFLEALAARSVDATDRVELVGVVVPQHFDGRRAAVAFAAKRRMERLIGTRDGRLASYWQRRGGPWHQIHDQARCAGAPVLWPSTCSSREVGDFVTGLRPDVVVVAGLDRILRSRFIDLLPPIYNVHPSLLPDYRGGLPEFWQLAAGATRGGVTLHRIDAGIDTGPIVGQRSFTIEPWFDADALLAASVHHGIELMHRVLDDFPDITERPVPAEHGSYFPLPSTNDVRAPFEMAATSVLDRARAVGWANPLHLSVARADWHDERTTRALVDQDAATLTLHVRQPSLVATSCDETPGTVWPTGGRLAIACNPGVVVFHHVEVSADG